MSVPLQQPQHEHPLALGSVLCGTSGRFYTINKILQTRKDPLICVYLATGDGEMNFILKTIFKSAFRYQDELQKKLVSPYVRTSIDAIPEHLLLVYEYFTDDLLRLGLRDMSDATRRRILRDALQGGSTSSRNNIKANNVLVDFGESSAGIAVSRVQIADIESAVELPQHHSINGVLLGNDMWRSPEAHAKARVGTPSDIFSFALVCIYTMYQNLVLAPPADLPDDVLPLGAILNHQVSFFSDLDGFEGFLEHIGDDNPWRNIFISVLMNDFTPEHPRQPFADWPDVDAEFRDLVVKMTSFDPKRRITAAQALEHPFFDACRGK